MAPSTEAPRRAQAARAFPVAPGWSMQAMTDRRRHGGLTDASLPAILSLLAAHLRAHAGKRDCDFRAGHRPRIGRVGGADRQRGAAHARNPVRASGGTAALGDLPHRNLARACRPGGGRVPAVAGRLAGRDAFQGAHGGRHRGQCALWRAAQHRRLSLYYAANFHLERLRRLGRARGRLYAGLRRAFVLHGARIGGAPLRHAAVGRLRRGGRNLRGFRSAARGSFLRL